MSGTQYLSIDVSLPLCPVVPIAPDTRASVDYHVSCDRDLDGPFVYLKTESSYRCVHLSRPPFLLH
jgi:hypothetical protein